MGAWLLFTVVLALIFWAFEFVRAKLTGRQPPWEERSADQYPTPPMMRAFWADIQLPQSTPEQRRRGLKTVGLCYGVAIVICASAAAVTWSISDDRDTAIGAAIIAFAVTALVGMAVAAAIDLRKRE